MDIMKTPIYDQVLSCDQSEFEKRCRKMLIAFGAFSIPFIYIILMSVFVRMSNIGLIKMFWPGYELFLNIALYTANAVSYHAGFLFFLFGGLIIHLAILFGVYFLCVYRRWKTLAGFLTILMIASTLLSSYFGDYRLECSRRYDGVCALMGRSIEFDELLETYGAPAYYREAPHYNRWVYTNGEKGLAVFVDGNGMAEVSNCAYYIFD